MSDNEGNFKLFTPTYLQGFAHPLHRSDGERGIKIDREREKERDVKYGH
jgi:hypothetical protein